MSLATESTTSSRPGRSHTTASCRTERPSVGLDVSVRLRGGSIPQGRVEDGCPGSCALEIGCRRRQVRLGTTVILALKNLLFTVLVPGTVAGYLPYRLSRAGQLTPSPVLRLVAAFLFALGLAGYLWCVWSFGSVGRGTPAPIDPPRRLVVVGLHRYVRNPMYLSVLTVIAGWVVLYQSVALAWYLGAIALMFHAVVLLYEEPALSSQFGSEYAAYRQVVGRWLPRVRRPRRREEIHAGRRGL